MKNSAPVIITIVAPVYGVERYFAQFAESVLGQSYPYIQYIFVNDGCVDSSIDILRSMLESGYQGRKEQVLIIDKENEGLPAARRTGMSYVEGDYVWHMDSDDWIEPDAVKKIADFALKTDADIISFDYFEERKKSGRLCREKGFEVEEKVDYMSRILNHQSCGCFWNKCVKKSLYASSDVVFPVYAYGEDIFVISQLVGNASSMAHLDEALYHYRKDRQFSLSSRKKRECRREIVLNYMKLYELLTERLAGKLQLNRVLDDMLVRIGWYSMLYGFGFWRRSEVVVAGISGISVRAGAELGIPVQLMLKMYAKMKNKLTR